MLDSIGKPMIAETLGANSLIRIQTKGKEKLFLVTHSNTVGRILPGPASTASSR
ncbi:MAG: hypothetical protein AB1648_02605 [Pseudomonadota bacterium]